MKGLISSETSVVSVLSTRGNNPERPKPLSTPLCGPRSSNRVFQVLHCHCSPNAVPLQSSRFQFTEVKALALCATKLSFKIKHCVVNYGITIPWPSFQATLLHCDVFCFTVLIAKERGSEARNPSNNVIPHPE